MWGGSFAGGVRAGEMSPPPTPQARRGLQGGEDVVSHWWSRKDGSANPGCVDLGVKEGEGGE